MLKRSLKLVLLILSLSPGFLYADDLFVSFGDERPPYVINEAQSGIEIDIFRAALAYKQHSITPTSVSNNRGKVILKTIKEVDAVATVAKQEGEFYYVDDFVYFENVVVTKQKKALNIHQISDLAGLSIVTWQGFSDMYMDYFSNADKTFGRTIVQENVLEAPTQEQQNKLFWRDSADVIIIDKAIFNYYRTALKDKLDTSDGVTFHTLLPPRKYFSVAFRDEQLANDFRAGLSHIKETGEYDEIYRRYQE